MLAVTVPLSTDPAVKGIPQRPARMAGAGSCHALRTRLSVSVPLTFSPPLSRSNAPWIKSNPSASFFIHFPLFYF